MTRTYTIQVNLIGHFTSCLPPGSRRRRVRRAQFLTKCVCVCVCVNVCVTMFATIGYIYIEHTQFKLTSSVILLRVSLMAAADAAFDSLSSSKKCVCVCMCECVCDYVREYRYYVGVNNHGCDHVLMLNVCVLIWKPERKRERERERETCVVHRVSWSFSLHAPLYSPVPVPVYGVCVDV